MIRLIAQYTVREGTLDSVEVAVRTFVAALARAEPATEYSAYRLGETRNFLHLMAFPDEAAQKTHQRADYTLRCVDALYANCEAPPTFTPITLID